MELLFKISFLIFSALFAGITLFLSTVLRSTFDALAAGQYYDFFSKIIVNGRKSMVISMIVLIPILIFVIYLISGFRNWLFIIGALIYISGSFVSSRIINEPLYTQFLKVDIRNQSELSRLRRLLNIANIIRTTLSLLGILFVGLSIYYDDLRQ